MLKKLFTDSRSSVLIIPVVILLVLLYQYSVGARIVYFLPDYPVTKSVSDLAFSVEDEQFGPYMGLEKCHFYGSCLTLSNGVDLDFVEPMFLVLLGYFAFMSGRERSWKRKILGGVLVSILYFVISGLQNLDWFHRCYEFCGIEYFFLWIPLVILYMVGIGVSWFTRRKESPVKLS